MTSIDTDITRAPLDMDDWGGPVSADDVPSHDEREALDMDAAPTTEDPGSFLADAIETGQHNAARAIQVGTRALAADVPAALRSALEEGRRRARGQARIDVDARKEREKIAQAALDGAIRVGLAGAGSYPHGALVGWRPSGEVSWATVRDAAIAGNVEPPAERSARAVASQAVAALKHSGYRVEVVSRGSSWRVYRSAGVRIELGQSIGTAEVLASLRGDDLHLEGPEALCAIVRGVWDLARSESKLTSTEVTAWLSALLRRWRAVPVCYGRWLPPGMVERWLALSGALNAAGLPVPSRPAEVSSGEDVREEIAAGLMGEVDALLTKIAGSRERAREQSKAGDVTARGAASILAELSDARDKIALYEMLVGPLTEARDAITAVETEVRAIANDTAQRGAMLELDRGVLPNERGGAR